MTIRRGTIGKFSWHCDADTQVFVLGKLATMVRDRGHVVLITLKQRIIYRSGVMSAQGVR